MKENEKDEAGEVSSGPTGKYHAHLAEKFVFLHKGNGKTMQNFHQRIFMARFVL